MGMTNAQIQEMITERFIKALEAGTVPWHKPWKTGAAQSAPRSLSTRKLYRGINVWLLGLIAQDEGYSSAWRGTYNRIAQLSGMVKKGRFWVSPDGEPRGVRRGEKGAKVVYWDVRYRENPDDPDGEPIAYWYGRTDTVFNACQADGLPGQYYGKLADAAEIEPLPEPQAVIDGYLQRGGPVLDHAHQDRAFYRWDTDMITLPERAQFDSPEAYYTTAFHECAHSTGHAKRLNRDAIDHFGSERYAKEELVAEMTAAMLCASTGIEGEFDNSASYVANWLKTLRNDPKMVSSAASLAQAALDLINPPAEEAHGSGATLAVAA